MIDFVKAVTFNQGHIKRLHDYANSNLKPYEPLNNNYLAYSNGSGRFRLEFRKVHSDNVLIGFRNVDVCFTPHYIFNNDQHNGNDLTPKDSVKIIREVFLGLGIAESELNEFQVVNLEFGLNLIPETNVKNIVDGLLFYNRTKFTVPNPKTPYFKITDSTRYKEIKAYAKGLQFEDSPHFGINPNTFRFEIKTKKSNKIKTLGISTIADLLKVEKFSLLFQSILDEWENVLILNENLGGENNTVEFWNELLSHAYRNKFNLSKIKYYKDLDWKDNFHHLIKCKIIDKLFEFQECADCPQKTCINIEKVHLVKNHIH